MSISNENHGLFVIIIESVIINSTGKHIINYQNDMVYDIKGHEADLEARPSPPLLLFLNEDATCCKPKPRSVGSNILKSAGHLLLDSWIRQVLATSLRHQLSIKDYVLYSCFA